MNIPILQWYIYMSFVSEFTYTAVGSCITFLGLPQTGWLKTVELHCHTVLEARSLNPGVKGHAPSGTYVGEPVLASAQLLVVAISLWGSLPCSCSISTSASIVIWHSPFMCPCLLLL